MRLIKGNAEDRYGDIRRKMLAKIHIAKKEARVCENCENVSFGQQKCSKCGGKSWRSMAETDYRSFLLYATGKTSCKSMNNFEITEVIRFFESAGFKGFKKADFKKISREVKRGMLRKLKIEAEKKLGADWKKRVDGFCEKKIGVSSIDFCDIYQLRQVWGFLRRI